VCAISSPPLPEFEKTFKQFMFRSLGIARLSAGVTDSDGQLKTPRPLWKNRPKWLESRCLLRRPPVKGIRQVPKFKFRKNS
jgi:hypothetical protein